MDASRERETEARPSPGITPSGPPSAKGRTAIYRLIPIPLGFVEVQTRLRFAQRQIDHGQLKMLPRSNPRGLAERS